MKEFQCAVLCPLVALIAALSPVAVTASIYEVNLRAYSGSNLVCNFTPEIDLLRGEPVACGFQDAVGGATGNGTVSVTGSAGPGWVQTHIATAVNANPAFSGFGYGGCSVVRTTIEDILVTGPAGGGTAEISVDISGDAAGDAPRDNPAARFKVRLLSFNSGGGIVGLSSNTFNVGVPEIVDTTFSSGPVPIQAGYSLTVELEISMTVGLFANAADTSNSLDIDFADDSSMYGMGFSRTGPVFDLTTGFTVNSLDGNIVNNQWSPPSFFDGFECDGLNAWSLSVP